MSLPADDHSDHTSTDAKAAKAADSPNFELVADADAKIAAPPADMSAKVEPTIEMPKAEPAKPEPAKSEPAKSEPPKLEPLKAQGSDAGKALATAGASPINPFLAAASEHKAETIVPPRSLGARLLDYSAHAAIIVGLIGFAWTVSDHVVNRAPKSEAPIAAAAADTKPAPTKQDEVADLRAANQKMHDEIRALRAGLDNLRTTVRHDTTPEQVRMLSAGLDNVKTTLAAAKSETNTEISQLSGKLDKLQPAKVQSLSDRVGRIERQITDGTATGSLGRSENGKSESNRAERDSEPSRETAKVAPKPPVKPQMLASTEEEHVSVDSKPSVVSGWVVRDVYEGVALIEGKYGTREVVPGTSIPGAGTVKSIDRKGSGWTVTTTKGQLAFAGSSTPSHRDASRDYRRGPYGRGGYGPYGDGY